MHPELEQQQDYIEVRNTKLQTFAHGRYTDEVWECCISLLSLGIGHNKIDLAIAIHTVLCLAGKTVEGLPAPSTINNMIVEAGVISKLQLGEVLPTTAFNISIQMAPPNSVKSTEDTKSQQQKPVIHLHCVIWKLARGEDRLDWPLRWGEVWHCSP